MGVFWGSTRYIARKITSNAIPNRVCRIVHSIYLGFLLSHGKKGAVASDTWAERRAGGCCFLWLSCGCIEDVPEWKPRAKRVAPPLWWSPCINGVLDGHNYEDMRMDMMSVPSGQPVESTWSWNYPQVPILATGTTAQLGHASFRGHCGSHLTRTAVNQARRA